MFLILDFTTTFNIAVLEKNSFSKKELNAKNNTSEILIDEIDRFFNKLKKNINKINSIYIITGPGSFTGVRSALTFAKTLSLIKKIKIFGLSKFELLNSCIKEDDRRRKRKIFIHFKDSQFFLQNFVGDNPSGFPKLINLSNYKTQYIKNTAYVCDKDLIYSYLSKKLKEDILIINFNLNKLPHLIKKNMIVKSEPKPLYINNYF